MSYTPTEWNDNDEVTSTLLNNLESGVTAVGYEPTQWSAGDVVTAEKLNKLEQGVADSADVFLHYIKRDLTEFTITPDMFPYQDINDEHWDYYRDNGYTDEEIEEYMFSYRKLSDALNFDGCTNLTKINGLDLIHSVQLTHAFAGCQSLTEIELPNATYIVSDIISSATNTYNIIASSGIKKFSAPKALVVADGGFTGGLNLEYCYLPKVTKIGNVFQGCSSLKRVYIGADCTEIGSACFGGSRSGLIIDCGFAQGAVSGASWASYNATINYNVPDPGSIDAMIESEA